MEKKIRLKILTVRFLGKMSFKSTVLLVLMMIFSKQLSAQTFPNPASLSTGQGAPNTIDPLWLASPWYAVNPPNPMGLTYISTLINNNCAPGNWVNPSTLPAPVNNGNWITGSDGNCATNTNSGYRYFRLTLNLPADCNGFSVTAAGNYVLDLVGYADNTISDVFVNGNSTGINGGSYTVGSQLNINLQGPWVVGTNYVDVLVFNSQSATPGSQNPYGLLLVADATTSDALDTDNDGISNLDDLCPCEAGTNPYGCTDPSLYNCDIDAIRQAMTNAGCIEMPGCSSDCSIYFLNPQQMTGSQAQAFAQNLGANLVSIQSQEENDCIMSSLTNLSQTGVIWIGFSDEINEGSFVWYDQSPIVYTNWAPGEPNQAGNEDCVQIYPAGANPGSWNDLSCGSSNSKSIIEVNLCPVINVGNDVSICVGSTANLNATNTLFGSSPYTYDWSNGPIVQSNPVSPSDTTLYSIVTTDRYNCTASDTVIVNVANLPIVIAGADLVLCPEETATLTGSGDLNNVYNWSNGISNATPFAPFTQSTNYVVTVTNASNCQNSDTVNVSVQLEGCPNFPNNYICDIDAIRADFTAAGCVEMVSCVNECSIYFLNQQSLSSTAAQAFAQNLGANLVSIQSQAENDCIVSSLVNLGLNSVSDVIWIGYNDEATEGTFGWYDQSPATYSNWAIGEPNSAGGNEDCVQIYPDGFWNNLPCGIGNAFSVIEVNLCPVMNAGNDISICIGSTANLNASNALFGSSPYTYTWSNGPIVQGNPVSPTDTTLYSIVTTDRYNCTAFDTVIVNVMDLPIVIAGTNVVLCPEETVTLTGSGDLNNTYSWNNGITNATPFSPFSQSTDYIVAGTNTNNCQNTDTVNVSVQLDGCPNFPNTYGCDIDAIRAAFTAAGCLEMVGCVNECSIYFLNQQSLSGSAAQAFAQNLGANLVSIQSQAENDCIVSSLVNLGLNSVSDVIWIGHNDEATEGTFVWYDQSSITYTNWAGGEPNNSGGNEDCVQIYPDGFWNDLPCGIGNARSVIEVNLCPVMNAGADQIICRGTTANLNAGNTILGSSPYAYDWSTGAQTQNTTVTPNSTATYDVASTDRYGCTTGDTLTVTVNSVPTAIFSTNNVCLGTNVVFDNQSTILGDVISQNDWTFGDGNTSTVASPTHNYATSNTFSVTLTVTTANGCSDIHTQDVTVYPIPEAPILISNSPILCPGDPVILQMNSTSNATYFWNGPNNFTSSNQNLQFPASFDNQGNYTAYVEVNGCPSPTVGTLVSIIGSLTAPTQDFPNVITPNGDGINDYLDIDQFFNVCLPYSLLIWNRWGTVVYEQKQGSLPFEGKDQSGAKLTEGVYFYKITFGEQEKQGTISILR